MDDALKLGVSAIAEVSLVTFLFGLAEATVIALILRWHHIRFSRTFSNRYQLANVLVPLAITTFLVILVVKSSLALSLGLVGALSIVRFRTPIKEPEDLIYLFMAIAVGLGTGAGQFLVTGAAVIAILLVIPFLNGTRSKHWLDYDFFVDVEATYSSSDTERAILQCIRANAAAANLTKLERDGNSIRISVNLRIDSEESLQRLMDEILKVSPRAHCTFLDTKAVFV